jgi:diguanylate cyclase (GGDEF)-like protein
MIDGFDTRTLTVIITLLATIQGINLCCYAKTHRTFKGFWQIGIGVLIIALGFTLVSFRAFIDDWFAITLAGLLVIYGIRSIGTGVLRFYGFQYLQYQKICNLLLILQLFASSYYAIVDFNAQYRVTVLCSIFAIQCFYLSYKLLKISGNNRTNAIRLIYKLYIFYGLLFLARAVWTAGYYQQASVEAHTIAHISSLMAFLLMVVVTSSIIIWSASERLTQELERQATIDPLTQIYNRRALESIAQKEIARSQRENKLFSVILMDIDHFKRVNDKYGHQFGDQVLVKFCQLISDNLRSYDIFARYGGEEFVLLLPNTSGPDVLKLAEKLRLIIREAAFSGTSNIHPSTVNEAITASFGVAESTSEDKQLDRLISQADKALYQAKQQGRNKVIHYRELTNLS